MAQITPIKKAPEAGAFPLIQRIFHGGLIQIAVFDRLTGGEHQGKRRGDYHHYQSLLE